MRKSDIYEVAIKIFGLYLLFTSIDLLTAMLTTVVMLTQVKQHPQAFGSFDQMPFFILSVANFVLVVLFALFLILKTKAIVKFVCNPTDYEETGSLFADRKVIYEIALVLMGLLLTVWILPDFVITLKEHIIVVQSDMPTDQYNTNFMITAAIKIVVGIMVIIYAKSLSTLFVKVNKKGNTE